MENKKYNFQTEKQSKHLKVLKWHKHQYQLCCFNMLLAHVYLQSFLLSEKVISLSRSVDCGPLIKAPFCGFLLVFLSLVPSGFLGSLSLSVVVWFTSHVVLSAPCLGILDLASGCFVFSFFLFWTPSPGNFVDYSCFPVSCMLVLSHYPKS